MLRSVCLLACALVLLSTGVGCVTSKLYDGPTRPASEIVVVSLARDRATLSFIEVDGQETGGRAVEVLPGDHRIRLMLKYMKRFDSGFVRTTFKVQVRCVARFSSQAGHRYVIRPVVDEIEAAGLQESITFEVQVEDEATPGEMLTEGRCYS